MTRSEWPSFHFCVKRSLVNITAFLKTKTKQTKKNSNNYHLHSSSKIGYNSSLIKVIFSFPPFQIQNKANQSRTKLVFFFYNYSGQGSQSLENDIQIHTNCKFSLEQFLFICLHSFCEYFLSPIHDRFTSEIPIS